MRISKYFMEKEDNEMCQNKISRAPADIDINIKYQFKFSHWQHVTYVHDVTFVVIGARSAGAADGYNHEVPKCLHPHLCYRGSGKACAGCSENLKASTPRDLARAWSVCSAPFNRSFRVPMNQRPLGDTYDSPGILKLQSYIEEMHPGIFIHSVYIDPDSKEDKRATFVSSELPPSSPYHSSPLLTQIREQYGNVDDQVELVGQQLKHLPQLSGGFDAIGFSQGLCRRSEVLP